MAKFTIEVPETFTVTSREKSVTLNIGKLSAELVAQAFLHGLTQKVADAAAGAEGATKEEKATNGQALMQKVVTNLESGNWGRVAAPHTTPIETAIRAIVRKLVNAKNPKALKAAEDKNAYLDAVFAKQPEAVRAKITAQAEADVAKAAEKAEEAARLAKGLGEFTL